MEVQVVEAAQAAVLEVQGEEVVVPEVVAAATLQQPAFAYAHFLHGHCFYSHWRSAS